MELFAKLVNGFSILDVWHGSKYICIITALLLASRTQPFKPASRLEEIKHFQEAVDYLISETNIYYNSEINHLWNKEPSAHHG